MHNKPLQMRIAYFANYLWYLGEVGDGGEIIHLLFPYMVVERYTVIRLDLKSL